MNPLTTPLHGQTMVDHMVDHSGPNLIIDNGSPSCSSSSSSSSSSYPHSSASLISSHFNVAIHCSPNQELTCGPYIAKALISNCTTALEMVLPFEGNLYNCCSLQNYSLWLLSTMKAITEKSPTMVL